MNLIDTHCHIDLYPNPHIIAEESEDLGIITIGMTLLPSHFELGVEHIKKFKKVRLALGMHPLKVEEHDKEFDKFKYYLDKTSYIGEIGLDFSKEGIDKKALQIASFEKILSEIKDKKKILSIHSRKAEKEVLNLLIKYNISNAIFHWYSGTTYLIKEIISNRYYFSVNPAMLKSENGRKIIKLIPMQNVLTESDGPFVSIGKNIIQPKDVILVINYLSEIWKINSQDVQRQIFDNFQLLISHLL
jgi:TatD DNase family protein